MSHTSPTPPDSQDEEVAVDPNAHAADPPVDSAGEGTPRISDAVGEAREIMDHAASHVRAARSVIASTESPFLMGILGLQVATSLVGSAIVFLGPFRDAYMHVGFYAIVFVNLLLYIKAHYSVSGQSRGGWWLSTTGLLLFWLFALSERVPARREWLDSVVVDRNEVTLLWLPFGMTVLVLSALAIHYLWLGRRWRKEQAFERFSEGS